MIRSRPLLAWLASVALTPAVGQSQPEPVNVDSLVSHTRSVIAQCDSQLIEFAYITTVHERELKDDGTVKSEKVSKSRHFVRGNEEREFLEAMWEDGEPVSASRLAEGQRKLTKEEEKRRKGRAKGKHFDDDRSQEMLGPLKPQFSADYLFPSAVSEIVDGISCWKLAVEPSHEKEGLVKGFIWIEQGTGRAVAEEYGMPKRPGPLKELALRLEHLPVAGACAAPKRFWMRGRGKALLVVKFHFEVEVFLDSMQVNAGLPDSVFSSP